MSVREWMTSDPVTIGPQTDLREALTRMVRHRVKHLPVVEEGRFKGMLCGPELVARILDEPELDLSKTGRSKALEFCQDVSPISPDDSVREAFQRLRQVTCLPVVQEGRLVGLISQGNLVGYLLGEVAPGRLRRGTVATPNRLEVLQGLLRDVSLVQDPQQILDVITTHVRTVMPLDQAFILLVQPGSDTLTVAGYYLSGDGAVPELMPIQDTLSGWVTTHRKSLRIEDLRQERRFPTSRQKLEDSAEVVELRSVVAVPLMDGRHCLGLLSLWSKKPHAYVDGDLDLLELVAGSVVTMVERSWQLAREKKLVEELQQANRIKDEFLAVVTHDLNNALQGVLSYSQLLARRVSDERGQRLGKGLLDTVNYMRTLTTDLHDLARLGMQAIRVEPGPVDLGEVVGRSLEDLADFAAKEQVELRTPELGEHLELIADRVRLRQVVDNLVTNAIKYNRPGGWVQVRAIPEDDWVRLEVEDKGIGIKPEEQELVFGLFARASNHKRSDSSGLGLSITRQLVELHGGSLSLQSAPDQGSTFYVRLPRSGPRTV